MIDWPTVSLGELTRSTRPICYGVLKPGPYVSGGVPLLRIVDIKENKVDLSDVHLISHDLDAEFSRSRLRGGEVLLSIQGTIGRVALCPESCAGANISRTIAVIDPDERLDKRFLRYYLLHLAGAHRFEVTGTTRDSLNIGAIRDLEIPVPPLDEQRRIVAILQDHLGRLDVVQGTHHRLSSRADALKRSLLNRMFHLEGDKDKVKRLLLGQVCEIKTGRTPSKFEQRLADSPRSDRVIPFYKVGDMAQHERYLTSARVAFAVDEAKTFGILLVDPGSVVFPKAGGAIATNKKRLMTVTGGIDLNCMAAVPGPEIDSDYLYWWFQQIDLAALSDGTVLPQLSKRSVEALEIPVPDLAEQRRVSTRLDDAFGRIDSVLRIMDGNSARVASLRRALLLAAFSGQLIGESINV